MPHNYNVSLFGWAIEKFNLKDGIFFRNELPWTLLPVIPITPICEILINYRSGYVSGATTIYTTPSDKDFYVNTISLSYSKNAASTAPITSTDVTVVINAQTITIAALAIEVTTAASLATTISFPRPVKLDRSSVIQLADAFSLAGAFTRQVNISGYVENTLA